jgi:chromosome segregation ATPase
LKWIKKLFGKKEDSIDVTSFKEIDFEGLPVWLDGKYQGLSSGIEKNISGLFRKLETALLELKESNIKLSEAKVEGDFDIRAVKRAKSNRENVIKQITTLIDKIKIPENTDFRYLKAFHQAAVQNLETCLENMDRSFKYAKGVFPEESKELSESLSRLSRVLNEFRETILENKEEIEAIEAAYSEIDEIQSLLSSSEIEKLELETKNRKLQVLQDEIVRTNQALEEFRKGEAWKNLQNLQEEFTVASVKLKRAKENLDSLVLPLSGHLSRIQKLHESGRYTLKPEVKQQLDICFKDFTHVDPSIFPEIQTIFEDKALDMQAQKKEKALLQLRALISGFPEREKEYLETLQEFEVKKAEIARSDTGKLAELEHKGTELLNRAHLLEDDIDNSKKKLDVLREELQNKKEKLLNNINLIDSTVKLNFKL